MIAIRKPRGLRHLTELTRARLGAAERVELRLPAGWPDTTTVIHWHARSAAGALHTGVAQTAAELPEAARSGRVHVWTPPVETLLTRAQLPTRSRAKILQALPYALEEQLIEEPEKLSFAFVTQTDGTLAVAITARARLDAWLAGLAAAGIRPGSLCPATLAVPLHTDAWTVAFIDDELWVRTGELSGFAAPIDLAAPPSLLVSALREAAANDRAPTRLVAVNPPRGFNAAAWRTTLGIAVDAENVDLWDPRAGGLPSLTLLQGEYAPAGQTHQLARPLRPAAIMLAIWFVGLLTVDTIEWWRLRDTQQRQLAEMNEIFKASFPDAKTVVDPAAQMQRNMESLQARGGGPADMLPLLARVAPTLKQQQQAKLQGIKYADRSLTLDVVLPNYESLDRLRTQLQSASLDVEVLAANGRANEVEGRLRIQPAGRPAKRS